MIVIGVSQLVYFFNSLSVPSYKILAILKAIYPLCFHTCFIIFLCSDDNYTLALTTIACLSIFLVGSFHHCIETIFKSVKGIHEGVVNLCSKGSKNQVCDINDKNKRKNDKVE